MVLFPLYAWEHIRLHRQRILPWSRQSLSGITQLIGGIILILSGIVLLLYKRGVLPTMESIHYGVTLILIISIAVHFFSKRKILSN